MIHHVFVGLTWALGAFGVTGTLALIAALVFLGPTAVIAIVQPVLTRFLACAVCVRTVVFIVAALGAYWLGHYEAKRECRAEEANSLLRAQQADIEAARKAKDDETARANSIESDANEQHRKDTDFIAKLQANPACGFDPDAGDGVRSSRPAGPKPPAGAGAPDAPAVGAASRFHLPLSLVQGRRMSGKRPERDAPSDGK